MIRPVVFPVESPALLGRIIIMKDAASGESRRRTGMNHIWGDIRYALRRLRRSPGFTAIAVLSLALAIGANTAVFSLYNAVMLKPLPVDRAGDLRSLTWYGDIRVMCSFCRLTSTPSGETAVNVVSYPIFQELRDQAAGMAELFAFSPFDDHSPLTVVARGEATTARGWIVSGNFFRALGVRPLIGQILGPEHDHVGSEPVTVLSHAAWQRHFGGDPGVLGQTVSLDQHTFMIIGVLPPAFLGPEAGGGGDFYVPMASQPLLRPGMSLETGDVWWVQVMGRVSPGASDEPLRAALELRMARALTAQGMEPSDRPVRVVVEEASGGPLGARRLLARPLPLLMGIVGIVLLAACANLASLLLARGLARQREMALRSALGAKRWVLVRQALVESLLVALAGGAAGLMLAVWAKRALFHMLWPSRGALDAAYDIRVLGFTLLACLVSALLFGVLPALRLGRANPMAALRERAAETVAAPRLGRWMVSTQTALAFVLIVGAGLFVGTLVRLHRVDTGFKPENLLTFSLDAEKAESGEVQRRDFHEQVSSSIAGLPGVRAVADSNLLLLTNWVSSSMARVPDRPDEEPIPILGLAVSDSFLSTMGIPLMSGRDFTATDDAGRSPVILVNETLARQVFPDRSPIGEFLTVHEGDYQIVGVFGDITYANLRRPPEPIVFYASRQQAAPAGKLFYEVRTRSDPMALVPAIRALVAGINRNVPLADVKSQARHIEESLAQERLFASLATGLALLAVLLSCVGLYGVMVHQVARRTGEIGVRMALGANGSAVAWLILRGAMLMAAAGIVIGLPAALAAVRLIRSHLFGIVPYDPATMVGAAILLFCVALLAAWIPARRAARIEPMVALRCE
jgi:predicted permease